MQRAFRIESGLTIRTAIARVEILLNRELCLTGSAKDRLFITVVQGPTDNFMTGLFRVAGIAGIITVAALKADGNDI